MIRRGNLKTVAGDPFPSWRRVSVLILLVYMGCILGLSLVPDEETSGSMLGWVPPDLQNLLHIPAFGILAVLWVWALYSHGLSEGRYFRFAFIFSMLFGLLSEIGQTFIPGRYPSITDFVFDAAGIIVGLWSVRHLNVFKKIRGATNA